MVKVFPNVNVGITNSNQSDTWPIRPANQLLFDDLSGQPGHRMSRQLASEYTVLMTRVGQ